MTNQITCICSVIYIYTLIFKFYNINHHLIAIGINKCSCIVTIVAITCSGILIMSQ